MFGLVDSRPTQAALRFFKERRVNVTFVDLRRKPIAAGE
jgi:arsenate reductase-like glutaredoxin family protein